LYGEWWGDGEGGERIETYSFGDYRVSLGRRVERLVMIEYCPGKIVEELFFYSLRLFAGFAINQNLSKDF